jgi:hypothetical protein
MIDEVHRHRRKRPCACLRERTWSPAFAECDLEVLAPISPAFPPVLPPVLPVVEASKVSVLKLRRRGTGFGAVRDAYLCRRALFFISRLSVVTGDVMKNVAQSVRGRW